jgi:2Fe-2S ferredoxin
LVQVNITDAEGAEHALELEAGDSLMRGATQFGVVGIDADCGGNLACATCHVILGADWIGRAGAVSSDEGDLLSFLEEREPGSRLSCQIILSDDLNGMDVRVPGP